MHWPSRHRWDSMPPTRRRRVRSAGAGPARRSRSERTATKQEMCRRSAVGSGVPEPRLEGRSNALRTSRRRPRLTDQLNTRSARRRKNRRCRRRRAGQGGGRGSPHWIRRTASAPAWVASGGPRPPVTPSAPQAAVLCTVSSLAPEVPAADQARGSRRAGRPRRTVHPAYWNSMRSEVADLAVASAHAPDGPRPTVRVSAGPQRQFRDLGTDRSDPQTHHNPTGST